MFRSLSLTLRSYRTSLGAGPDIISLTGTLRQAIGSIPNVAGNYDVFTVPTGKRAVILTSKVYLAGGTTPTLYLQLWRSGTYYQLSAASAQNAPNAVAAAGFVFEAADKISFNSGAGNIANYCLSILEFDAPTSGPRGLFTAANLGMSNGNNTILTVATGCNLLFPQISANGMTISGGGTVGFVMNLSGANRAYNLYQVPSGGSAGADNQLSALTAQATGARATLTPNGMLTTGDSVVISTDSGAATQSAWVTAIEIDQ